MTALATDRIGAARSGGRHPRRVDVGRLVFLTVCAVLLTLNAVAAIDDVRHMRDRRPAELAAMAVAKVLLVLFYAVAMRAYLRRGPATASDARPIATAAAFIGTALPLVIPLAKRQSEAPAAVGAGIALLLAGLAWSLWSVRVLGRSLSVIPQARALVTAGPYASVRHPLYLGEIVASLGLVAMRPAVATIAIWSALCAVQLLRARFEEAVLSASVDGYGAYRAATKRLVPGLY